MAPFDIKKSFFFSLFYALSKVFFINKFLPWNGTWSHFGSLLVWKNKMKSMLKAKEQKGVLQGTTKAPCKTQKIVVQLVYQKHYPSPHACVTFFTLRHCKQNIRITNDSNPVLNNRPKHQKLFSNLQNLSHSRFHSR